MCIIVGKLKGVELPTDEILDNCYRTNRDGIGVAYANGSGLVHIKKDFETLESFKVWLRTNITKDGHACMIHYRLATSGLTDCGNRHPFPVTADKPSLRKVETECEMAVAHNGVFQGLGDKKYSDTQEFIVDILSDPLIHKNLDNKSIQELMLAYLHSSKLMFLSPKGDIHMFGAFEKDADIYYSNKGYETYRSYYNDDGKYEAWKNKVYDAKSGKWIDKDDKPRIVQIDLMKACFACRKEFAATKMLTVRSIKSDSLLEDKLCKRCFYKERYSDMFYIDGKDNPLHKNHTWFSGV